MYDAAYPGQHNSTDHAGHHAHAGNLLIRGCAAPVRQKRPDWNEHAWHIPIGTHLPPIGSERKLTQLPLAFYLDLIYGLPLAEGTWERPTNRISTITVTTNGIMEISCAEITLLEPSTILSPEHMPNSRQASIAP